MNISRAHLANLNPSANTALEPLLSVEQLADYLGVPVKTVYDWRRTGHGPAAHRVGRFLRYTVADVQEWLAQQRDPSPGPSPRFPPGPSSPALPTSAQWR
jgi:excisionase family DNA binding protein